MVEQVFEGVCNVVILLFMLGEQDVVEVFKYFFVCDVQVVGLVMVGFISVICDQVEQVFNCFNEDVGWQIVLGVGIEDYICKIFINVLGESKVGGLIDCILFG